MFPRVRIEDSSLNRFALNGIQRDFFWGDFIRIPSDSCTSHRCCSLAQVAAARWLALLAACRQPVTWLCVKASPVSTRPGATSMAPSPRPGPVCTCRMINKNIIKQIIIINYCVCTCNQLITIKHKMNQFLTVLNCVLTRDGSIPKFQPIPILEFLCQPILEFLKKNV